MAGKEKRAGGKVQNCIISVLPVPSSGTGEALVARKGYTALCAGQRW